MSQDEQNSDAEGIYVEVASEEASPAIEAATSLKMEKMREYQLEMIDIAQANANSAFDFARDLSFG